MKVKRSMEICVAIENRERKFMGFFCEEGTATFAFLLLVVGRAKSLERDKFCREREREGYSLGVFDQVGGRINGDM